MYYAQNTTKKCLLLTAILILAGFAFYFHAACDHVYYTLLKERRAAAELNVDYFCDMVDYLVERDGGWDMERYRDTLVAFTECVDATSNVYAELMDESYMTLSERILPEEDSWWFEPREFPDLMKQLKTENAGTCDIVCPCGSSESVTVYLHWRWVPTDIAHENRVLLMVGVTQYSVNASLASWVYGGVIALLFTAAVFIIGSIILLTAEPKVSRRT